VTAPREIAEDVLTTPVAGVNLVPGSLRRQLSPTTTLFVFLRHFGCMFCRETIADLRACTAANAIYPKVLLFAQAGPVEARTLLRDLWSEAHCVCDPDRRLYAAFGVERGTWRETLGPAVWRARSRASAKGHTNGERSGDVWMMPGAFLVQSEHIVWSHTYRHAADHPDFALIPELADTSAEDARRP